MLHKQKTDTKHFLTNSKLAESGFKLNAVFLCSLPFQGVVEDELPLPLDLILAQLLGDPFC